MYVTIAHSKMVEASEAALTTSFFVCNLIVSISVNIVAENSAFQKNKSGVFTPPSRILSLFCSIIVILLLNNKSL